MKTLAEHMTALLAARRARGCSVEAVMRTGRNLEMFLTYLETRHGVVTVDQLRPDHLEQWVASLRRHRTVKGAPLAPSTVNNRIQAARILLRCLHERRVLVRDLVKVLPYVKLPSRLPTSVLAHEQLRAFLDTMNISTPRAYRDRVMLELLYSCGLRNGELCTLTLGAVNLDDATLRVIGKGDKERIVPFGRTAARLLENYIRAVRPFLDGAGASEALFLNNAGNPMRTANVQAMFRRCFAGDPQHVTPHTMRRSCATELIRNEANLYHVKELLGHESVETLKAYTKLTIVDLKRTHAKCHPRERDGRRRRRDDS